MKYINNYQDYLREYKDFNPQNLNTMNEGWKHWLSTFLMLVNLGIVPPAIAGSKSDDVKMEFTQSEETLEKVASKFEAYYIKNDFYNTPELGWEDFQKVYGQSLLDLDDILDKTTIKHNSLFTSARLNDEIPNPTNYVNDYAELVFPQSQEDSLNAIISRYEKTSGMEIAIVTVNTFGEGEGVMTMPTFCNNIFKKWGIGKKGADNGILIALSEKDRDWRIQTGYGAEIVLPDNICSRFGREIIVPNFKNGEYTKGIQEVVDAIIKHIGTDSEDIKQFQEDYKTKKAEQLAAIGEFLLNALGIILVLAILGVIIHLITKKYKTQKELKEKSKSLLLDINAIVKVFNENTKNTKDTEYISKLIKEFESIINTDLPTEPTTNTELINKLFSYTKTLNELLTKSQKFNKAYSTALNVDMYTQEAKKYVRMISDIEDDLSYYNIKSTNKLTVAQIDDLSNIVKKSMGNSNIFGSIDILLGELSNVKSKYSQIWNIQTSIPNMLDTLKNYEKDFVKWTKELEKYNLNSEIKQLGKMKIELEELLKLDSSEVMKQYKKYDEIKRFAEGAVYNVLEGIRRKKEEEERRKRRKREEEEEDDRRRRNSYSSSSSSYSSSSSSFGGFGGGSSGGGGAGGKF
jgi:uncharacterized protein